MSGLGRDETLELMQEECMELRRERDKLQAENERLERQLSELHGEIQIMREEHQQDLEILKERSGE